MSLSRPHETMKTVLRKGWVHVKALRRHLKDMAVGHFTLVPFWWSSPRSSNRLIMANMLWPIPILWISCKFNPPVVLVAMKANRSAFKMTATFRQSNLTTDFRVKKCVSSNCHGGFLDCLLGPPMLKKSTFASAGLCFLLLGSPTGSQKSLVQDALGVLSNARSSTTAGCSMSWVEK